MARNHRRGFTLIEMMAVVALVGMIFALGLPRLSSSRWRALGDAAESIAASLEFARQRAIMTGIPHRVLIDLEDGGWRVEWLVSESQALAGGSEDGDATAGSGLIDALAGLPDPDADGRARSRRADRLPSPDRRRARLLPGLEQARLVQSGSTTRSISSASRAPRAGSRAATSRSSSTPTARRSTCCSSSPTPTSAT